MTDTQNDAGGATRRRSLLKLGGAGLATVLAASQQADRAKASKKAKKRVKQTCRRQIGACRGFFSDLCAADPDCGDEQLDSILPCCELLNRCQAGASVECFFAVVAG